MSKAWISAATLAVLVTSGAWAAPMPGEEMSSNIENCFDDVGCADIAEFQHADLVILACDNLWEIRNRIFKVTGYCFKTPVAIHRFGNSGCLYDDENLVPLNDYQLFNVKLIREIEAEKSCTPPVR